MLNIVHRFRYLLNTLLTLISKFQTLFSYFINSTLNLIVSHKFDSFPSLDNSFHQNYSKFSWRFASPSYHYHPQLRHSIFQLHPHFEFCLSIANTHHRPQAISSIHPITDLNYRFISFTSNQYPTSNHQSQISSLCFHSSDSVFNHPDLH